MGKKEWQEIGKIVKLSNNLVEGHWKLNEVQQKILIVVAKAFNNWFEKYENQLNKEDIGKYHTVETTSHRLAQLLDIKNNDYRYIRQTIQTLQKCLISYRNEEEKWESDIPVFAPCKYYDDGRITIKVNEVLLPMFFLIQKEYTQYNSLEVMQFNSKYTIRIYGLVAKIQNQTYKVVTYSLDDFCKKVGCEYKTWSHIETKVLLVAKKELKEKSIINFKYEAIIENIGRGRPKVVALKLILEDNINDMKKLINKSYKKF